MKAKIARVETATSLKTLTEALVLKTNANKEIVVKVKVVINDILHNSRPTSSCMPPPKRLTKYSFSSKSIYVMQMARIVLPLFSFTFMTEINGSNIGLRIKESGGSQ